MTRQLVCSIRTPLGDMRAQVDDDYLSGLWFADQKHIPEITSEIMDFSAHSLCLTLSEQLDSWFAGRLMKFDLPLALRGSSFRMAVWELLCNIPYGETTTYGALAQLLAGQHGGKAPAPQAVGGAVGHNPLSIIIPCHRVVGADGSLTGYAGGLERKAALLSLEQRNAGGAG